MEMQYKKGISRIADLYQQEGDKKSRMDAESKRIENEKKIQLLQMSLKRYKNLHVLDVNEEEEGELSEGPLASFAFSNTIVPQIYHSIPSVKMFYESS